jgi:hypothetical protein
MGRNAIVSLLYPRNQYHAWQSFLVLAHRYVATAPAKNKRTCTSLTSPIDHHHQSFLRVWNNDHEIYFISYNADKNIWMYHGKKKEANF